MDYAMPVVATAALVVSAAPAVALVAAAAPFAEALTIASAEVAGERTGVMPDTDRDGK
jgi:hypothetical protein